MKTLRFCLAGAFALAAVGACDASTQSRSAGSASADTVVFPSLRFPPALLHQGLTWGEVRLIVKVGPDARLVDALVTSYSNRDLADYTLDALGQARFQPSVVDHEPVTTVVRLTVQFETRGVIAVERFGSDRVENTPGRFAYEPCEAGRLDRPLQPITVVPPAYSLELGQQRAKGSVVLDYYVDESGRVRMPTVRETGSEILAGLTLAAIEQWRFQPPSSQNKPVLVHVRQKFEFVPEGQG